MSNYKTAVPNNSGIFRVYGTFGKYGSKENPARIWKAWSPQGITKLEADTILIIKDASGFTDEVLAGENLLMFDTIQKKN